MQAQIDPERLEGGLKNKKCFTTESNVGVFWESLSFSHPWCIRMKAFTKTFFESGVFCLFQNIDRHPYRRSSHSVRAKQDDAGSFIKLKEAQPIFFMCLSLLLAAAAVFIFENHKLLILKSLLVCSELKWRMYKCALYTFLYL